MKHILFLICLCFCGNSISAQSYQYVDKQRLDSIIFFNVFDTATSPVPHYKLVFAYDSTQLSTNYSTYSYETLTDEWFISDSTVYSYNNNGQIAGLLMYMSFLDAITQQVSLKVIEKKDYFYDTTGILKMINKYWWNQDLNQLQYERTEAFTYNAAGNKTLWELKNWDSINGIWHDYVKFSYSYDTLNQQLVKEQAFSWNNYLGPWQWEEYCYIDFEYDSTSNKINAYTFNKSYPAFQWELVANREIFLNVSSNTTHSIYYSKNYDNGNLEPSMKEDFNYDYNYPHSDLIVPTFEFRFPNMFHTSEFGYMITECTSSFYFNQQFIPQSTGIYYYSTHVDSVPLPAPIASLAVFPNPARDYITFNSDAFDSPAQIFIYDITGKQRMSLELYGKNRIPLEGISRGMYFYTVTDGKRIWKGKFIVL